jgi:hypothetical protein
MDLGTELRASTDAEGRVLYVAIMHLQLHRSMIDVATPS